MATCTTRHCRNPRTKHSSRCAKCHTRWYAQAHLVGYAFNNCRKRARQRLGAILGDAAWTLTKEQYLQAFQAAGLWLDPTQPKPRNHELDRIDIRRGYEPGNVQVLHTTVHLAKTIRERGGVDWTRLGRLKLLVNQATTAPF